MGTVVFVYVENAPIDYRAFVQWLFWVTPNLRRDRDGRCWEHYVLATIEIGLNVSRPVAEKLLANAVRLGLARKENVHCTGDYYEPDQDVKKP